MITDGGEQQGEGGQALLTVDYEKLLQAGGRKSRAGGEHERAEEVRGRRSSSVPIVGKLHEVVPKPMELFGSPRVCPLVQRHLILLRTL